MEPLPEKEGPPRCLRRNGNDLASSEIIHQRCRFHDPQGERVWLPDQGLKTLGYKQVAGNGWQRKGDIFRFDLFEGNRIHTTELLESPLEPSNHSLVKEYSRLYIGILNDYDLIASKLMRGTAVDFADCLMLMKSMRQRVDIGRLVSHYRELVSYDIAEARISVHIDRFIELLEEEKIL
jgi:hypothetical protein